MSIPIKPLADRVVAVREEKQSKTTAGLYLPETAKEKPVSATVVAVGPDVKSIKKGNKVIFKEYTPTEIKVDKVTYLIIKEEDVLALLA